VLETLHLPHTIEPPAGRLGDARRHLPAGRRWKGKSARPKFRLISARWDRRPASTYSPLAPHPYMQKTRTLEFGIVQEGEIVLVLDTQEVTVRAGDFVVLRGSNHAWSNRSSKPAVVAIASHDGR
jgi:hypothetical protein